MATLRNMFDMVGKTYKIPPQITNCYVLRCLILTAADKYDKKNYIFQDGPALGFSISNDLTAVIA